MKRNVDLIRALLLRLESMEKPPEAIVSFHPKDEAIGVEGFG